MSEELILTDVALKEWRVSWKSVEFVDGSGGIVVSLGEKNYRFAVKNGLLVPTRAEVLSTRSDDKLICEDGEAREVWTVVVCGRATGYRFEIFDKSKPYFEDVGTLLVVDGKPKFVNW